MEAPEPKTLRFRGCEVSGNAMERGGFFMMWTKQERIRRDIEELAKCNATPGQGLTRFSLTAEDRQARIYLKQQMTDCGLAVREDAAGNVVGRREGLCKDGPVVMIGSHYDSVKQGGNFDGPAGVSAALETVRVFAERGIQTYYPIEVVAMIEEEGARFGASLYGSRAMTGQIDVQQLKTRRDQDGLSMYEALKDFGFEPENIFAAKREPEKLKAFLELHIEQGPVLETEGFDVGIVEKVVGIHDLHVKVKGKQGHAGTVPMHLRADSLNLAAKVIAKMADFAVEAGEGTVATVGKISVKPGGFNIIPGETEFTIDVRSSKESLVNQVVAKIEQMLAEQTKNSELQYEVTSLMKVPPVQMDEQIMAEEIRICQELGLKHRTMLSGAGHDAMVMAAATKASLIFVPSLAGRSHCPEEWTDYEQLQKGVELYCRTVLKVSQTGE